MFENSMNSDGIALKTQIQQDKTGVSLRNIHAPAFAFMEKTCII